MHNINYQKFFILLCYEFFNDFKVSVAKLLTVN